MPVTTHPTNILDNGGFEYGLMCYGNWVWSKTGKDYTGDYDFHLSTDAHGGTYAAELRCNGSDCGWPAKSALQTLQWHSPASQAYKVTVYTKCASGEQAFFYTASDPSGNFSKPLACTGAWAMTEVDFTSAATAGDVGFALYYAGTTSMLIDDVVVTYGDGTVPAHTVSHGGTRSVSVSKSAVLVDGAPYLALGFFGVPYDALATARQMGTNTVTFGADAISDCFNDDRGAPYADHAYELGINLAPDSTTTARLQAPGVYPAVVAHYGPHLANIAWYLDDEPDQVAVPWYGITPANLAAEHDQAHTKSSLPIFSDFQHAAYDVPSVDTPYAPSADFYMAEPYGNDFSSVDHADTVFQAMGANPSWLAQDAADAAVIVPKAYYVVVTGSTGILYFTWAAFQADATKMAAATQAFAELGSLQKVIFATDVGATVTGPAGVKLMARSSGGQTYILAVNPGATAVTGNFTVSGASGTQSVTVQFENRTLTATNGTFADTFPPVSRHVYVLP